MCDDLDCTDLAEHITHADILLISGPTCSGKTTLSRKLETEFGASVLHGDDWALSERDIFSRTGGLDFECPEAYDVAALRAALVKILTSGSCECPVFDFAADAIVDYREIARGSGPIVVEFLHSFLLRDTVPEANSVTTVYVDCAPRIRFA